MSELPKYVLVRLSHDVGNPTEIKAEYEPNPDVVPVVRCGECKHTYLHNGIWRCTFGMLIPGRDGYCSYGEKVKE